MNYLLDTNILLIYLRNDQFAAKIDNQFYPSKKDFSVGEMISKKNFTGIDPNKFESIVNELEIKEPLTVLIKAVLHER
jgi:hypothetical protein